MRKKNKNDVNMIIIIVFITIIVELSILLTISLIINKTIPDNATKLCTDMGYGNSSFDIEPGWVYCCNITWNDDHISQNKSCKPIKYN